MAATKPMADGGQLTVQVSEEGPYGGLPGIEIFVDRSDEAKDVQETRMPTKAEIRDHHEWIMKTLGDVCPE